MSREVPLPHPVEEARRATKDGKYGLKNMGFLDPKSKETAYATTIEGVTGPELVIDAPNGQSYWTNNGTVEHICGYPPEGDFTVPLWSATPRKKTP